jgi:dihydroorotase
VPIYPNRGATIRAAALRSRACITPFEGMAVRGAPVHTPVRGHFVMRDGALVPATRGWGRSVRRVQRMAAADPCNRDQTIAAALRGGPAG